MNRPCHDEPASFVRRDDGIWCRKDVKGILYCVNGIGQRCAKPKTFEKSEGNYSDQRRPAEISQHVWWTIMTKAERLQWWIDQPGGAPAVSTRSVFTCSPIGISSLMDKAAGSLVQTWNRGFYPKPTVDTGCYDDAVSDDESVISEKGETPLPWDDWETFVAELGQPGVSLLASCSTPKGSPRLPRRMSDDVHGHRDKLGTPPYPDKLCVARPVGKAEIERTPAAKEAMKKEWDRLRLKYVWDEAHPREWDDVRLEARRGGGVYRTPRIPFLVYALKRILSLLNT